MYRKILFSSTVCLIAGSLQAQQVGDGIDLSKYCTDVIRSDEIDFDVINSTLECFDRSSSDGTGERIEVPLQQICEELHETGDFHWEDSRLICVRSKAQEPIDRNAPQAVSLADYCVETYGLDAELTTNFATGQKMCSVRTDNGLRLLHYAIDPADICEDRDLVLAGDNVVCITLPPEVAEELEGLSPELGVETGAKLAAPQMDHPSGQAQPQNEAPRRQSETTPSQSSENRKPADNRPLQEGERSASKPAMQDGSDLDGGMEPETNLPPAAEASALDPSSVPEADTCMPKALRLGFLKSWHHDQTVIQELRSVSYPTDPPQINFFIDQIEEAVSHNITMFEQHPNIKSRVWKEYYSDNGHRMSRIVEALAMVRKASYDFSLTQETPAQSSRRQRTAEQHERWVAGNYYMGKEGRPFWELMLRNMEPYISRDQVIVDFKYMDKQFEDPDAFLNEVVSEFRPKKFVIDDSFDVSVKEGFSGRDSDVTDALPAFGGPYFVEIEHDNVICAEEVIVKLEISESGSDDEVQVTAHRDPMRPNMMRTEGFFLAPTKDQNHANESVANRQ